MSESSGEVPGSVSPPSASPKASSSRSYPQLPSLLFWGGLVGALAAFFAGAWERRWIADDGLIVLRTVRNLAAGNGPVFNAGERVESNTSTLWTYFIYFAQQISGYRLELVALTLALSLSLAAVAFAMLGSRVMHRGTRKAPAGEPLVLLPFGVLIYIVLPPARDFASSGLESGLVIAWIGAMWWAMQRWARCDPWEGRAGLPSLATGLTAFVAGLGPLVRPELALVSAALLALLALARQSWKQRGWLVLIAGLVPVVYQVWRMSYYALPYPVTAVAKDAGGSKWGKGLAYLWNLLGPYTLLLPVVVAVIAAVVLLWSARHRGALTGGFSVRSTAVVSAVFPLLGLLMTIYVLRVGGDFMHGRVLLPPLFLLLLPVAVLPFPTGAAQGEVQARLRRITVPVLGVAWLTVAGWALTVQFTENPFRDRPEEISASGIVDERQFYIQNTGRRHPLLAEDYLDFPRMRALVRDVTRNETGAVFIAVPGMQDRWDVVAYDHPYGGAAPFELPEEPIKTVVFINLGMTSMNLPLDVSVYDTVGLSAPLAAHTRRMEDGRIGHDKFLPYDWVLAKREVIDNPENYPRWIDVNWVNQAQVALSCPATQAVVDSYSAPLTLERRWSNLVNAFSYAKYRIDRIPAYEVQRCGLPMPEEVEKHPGTK